MNPVQTTQDTNLGTSTNSYENVQVEGPTRDDLNKFHELVAIAVEGRHGMEMPEIEVPRKIITHFNRVNLAGFDEVGYFVYSGVKVYEIGKKDEAKRRDAMSMEEKNFGAK